MPDSSLSPDPALSLPERGLLESLTGETQGALAKSVSNDYKRWKQSRARLENRWKECWEAYLCDVKGLYTEAEEPRSDRSRIARPVLYEAVEAIHANLLNALFPVNERFFTVLGKTETDQRNASLIEEFLRNKLEDAGFVEKYALFLKQAIITGNTVAAAPWRKSRQQRTVNKPVRLFGMTVGYQKVSRETVTYNGPDFEVLDMFDFLIDPDATDFEQAKLIRRVDRSLLSLKGNPVYHNLDRVKPNETNAWDASESNKNSRRKAFGLDETPQENNESMDTKVTLLEAWGDFIIGDTVYENHVCVIANQDTVIRFEPNPYEHGMKPFVFTSFIPVPNEVYGIGAIEKSLGLQHANEAYTHLDIRPQKARW